MHVPEYTESVFFGCGGNSLPAAGEQRVCGRGLRLLPQGHVQYGVGKSVGVGFVAISMLMAVFELTSGLNT